MGEEYINTVYDVFVSRNGIVVTALGGTGHTLESALKKVEMMVKAGVPQGKISIRKGVFSWVDLP